MNPPKKPVAWSHTALTAFETCPKRYFHLRVAKDVVEPTTEVLRHGQEVHKRFELRLVQGTPLPSHLAGYESMVQSLLNKKGDLLVEKQLAINKSFQPVSWFDKSAWCRGVIDVGVVDGDKAVLLDWKTGKRKPDNDQLSLFAGLAFAHFDNVKTIYTGFAWLTANKLDKDLFTREHVTSIWNNYLPRVARLEHAYEQEKWNPKPSGLCRKHCPVPRTKCEFSGG